MSSLQRLLSRLAVTAIAVPALAIAALLLYLYVFQENIIFAGTALPADHEFSFHVPFEEVSVEVEGAMLSALHFRQESPRGLIFFLHGNGGNLQSWTSNIDYYRRVNYDLFIFDYRGYGKSSGEIGSEAQLHADVRAAWDLVAPHYQDKPVVIYGRSLGSALAVKLAREVDPRLLVLVSPFTSMVALAQQQYWFVPSSLVRYPFRTDEIITGVSVPIVLVHGDRDTLIPLQHSRELTNLAARSELLVIEGAGHNDIHAFADYIDGLTSRLPD